MKLSIGSVPLRWRLFLATSTTVTLLFAMAGWALEQYVISVADASARAEIQASIRAYEAIWKARTQVLLATTAVMGAMSDVRAAFETRDEKTIRDSAQELWSRVSDQSAIFLVLDPQGRLISRLGESSSELNPATIPVSEVSTRFPNQLSGYLRDESKLFYVVLTPVFVAGSHGPLLLNILCAGFRIDDRTAGEMKALAPGSDFAFIDIRRVFGSTLDRKTAAELPGFVKSGLGSTGKDLWKDQFIVSHRPLVDLQGAPVAELGILYSYSNVRASLTKLRRVVALTWILTIAAALAISSYMTRKLLRPIRLLDQVATAVAAGDYKCRVPVQGTDELSRLAKTFNHMCKSIEQAQEERIRQEQMQTIARLGSSLVHDLRNPLAAIYGGAEMLVDGNLPASETLRIARTIYRASQRMQSLLLDLFQISRGERRKLESCKIKDLLSAAVEPILSTHPQLQIAVDIDETLEIVVDFNSTERVFANLLANSVEAMPDGGRISITARSEAQYIDLFFSDTGPGVPDKIREDIFKPFVTGKRQGTGLGLALSRQSMTDIGGDLSLVKDGAQGACFRLRFPRAAAHAERNKEQLPVAG